MIGGYSTVEAFRKALETRLATRAHEDRMALQPMRVRVAIGRLLARLFSEPGVPWVVKGGVAMELRFRPHARTTRDLDLGVRAPAGGWLAASTAEVRVEWLVDALQQAAAKDLGDGFEFRIAPSPDSVNAPLGGRRHAVDARLAGRTFDRFHLDVGIGEPFDQPETLRTHDDLLAFAAFPEIDVAVVPARWQFADKLAMYCHRWNDRVNTRSKDLVDLVKFIESGLPCDSALRLAIETTFHSRGQTFDAADIPEPPKAWVEEFAEMAKACDLRVATVADAVDALRGYLG